MFVHKDLLACESVVSPKTGELVKFTLLTKILYSMLASRNKYFTTIRNAEHYESQESLAQALGSDRQAVGRLLRGLESGGFISVERRKVAGFVHTRNVYLSVNQLLTVKVGEVFKEIDILRLDNKKDCGSIVDEYSEAFLASIDFGEG